MVLASLCIAMLIVPAVQAAPSTSVSVIRYANDCETILNQKSYTYQQLEREFPVHGDGMTHYYFQGPTFNESDPWDPGEWQNVDTRDFGAVKGTDIKDLCEAVGGMSPGETVRFKATDGFQRDFSYEAVYGTDPRKGPMVLAWYNGEESQGGYELQGEGYPDTGYYKGMRLFFFADTSGNTEGKHVFGHWDMHETLPESDWYYYNGIWPSSGGLSVYNIDRILIYSDDDPVGGIQVTSVPDGARILLDGADTGEVTNITLTDMPPGEYLVSLALDGYEEAEETVTVVAGRTVPVHVDLVPMEGMGDSGADGDPDADSGYRGRTLTTLTQGTLNGSLAVYRSSEAAATLAGGKSAAYTIPAPLPPNATVRLARLCLYTTGGWDRALKKGAESSLSVTFDGRSLSPDRKYRDVNASDNEEVLETVCYDVTALAAKGGNHTVDVRNTGSGDTTVTLYGAVLIAVNEDASRPAITYWIAEGCDAIRADPDEGVLEDAATTEAEFAEDVSGDIAEARLTIIATAATGTDERVNRILMNEGEWDNHLDGGTDSISIVGIDVRPYLKQSGNHAEVRSIPVQETGDYLEVRHAILVLAEGMAGAEPAGNATPTGTPTPPATAVETTLTPAASPTASGLTNTSQPQGGGGILGWLQAVLDGILQFLLSPFSAVDVQNASTGAEPTLSPLPTTAATPAPGEETRNRTASLSVATIPPSAMVYLDGVYTGRTTPVRLEDLPCGSHSLRLELEGFTAEEREVLLEHDANLSIVLRSRAKPFPDTIGETVVEKDREAVHSGGLYITSFPSGARVTVDNRKLDKTTPCIVYGLKEGQHTVRLTIGQQDAESETARVWVYPQTISPLHVEMNRNEWIRTITVESEAYRREHFTVNGAYPLKKVPATADISGLDAYITFLRDGSYRTYRLDNHLNSGDVFDVPTADLRLFSLRVESEPAGADIFIDGYATGYSTPYRIENISEGPHRVMLSKPGYTAAEKSIRLGWTPGEPANQTIRLRLEEYVWGFLTVDSTPAGAKIYIDGRDSGEKTPHTFPAMPIGSYDVKVVGETASRTRERVTVVPGQNTRITVDLT
ncbi:MAG: PEGA domain-containing protein [Methanomicrobiales archaeon]|nr:PEGA domain-containing protein [Methanomicrobiales archaeon]